METVTVRPARPSDLPRLAHLWYEKTVLQQQVERRIRIAPDGRDRWTAAAADWLEDSSRVVLVAEREEVVGYVIARVQPSPPGLLPERMGVIEDMAIDAHGYHPGVGRSLYRAARDWLTGQGVEGMVVGISRRYAVEQAFWRAMGATEWMDWLWMKS